ncbi:translocation/assembly module TamB domain-containing protein [Geofilum sp. OHC36d9]|uniref:translocation/assembly module TamB domain-containing protein n=1 Tax=Geofilum sp. OHC36d9 TaxID=3458413 RepID=UPI004034B407
MKKTIKISLWFCLAILLLIATTLGMMQSQWFKTILKNKTVTMVNQQINGTLELQNISGNLFTNLRLTGVVLLLPKGDTLITIKQIKLKYAPLALINGQVIINQLLIEEPLIYLQQRRDSSWNFQELLPPAKPDTSGQPSSSPTKLSFFLNEMHLTGGTINLDVQDTILPKKIKALDLQLNAFYSAKKIMTRLENLSFTTFKPNFRLRSFQANLESDFSEWLVNKVHLQTAQNEITFEGAWQNTEQFEATLNWNQINLHEFRFFIPEIPTPATPDLQLWIKTQDKQTDVNLTLTDSTDQISIGGYIYQLPALLTDSLRHNAFLNLIVKIQNLTPHHWVKTTPIPLILNARFAIKGNGLTASSPPLSIHGKLNETIWEGLKIDSALIDASYLNGLTRADINIAAPFGKLSVNSVLDLFNPQGNFTAQFSTQQLMAYRLMPDILDSTIISIKGKAVGKGLGTDSLTADFSAQMLNSVVEYVTVDTLNLRGSYQYGNLTLDTLTLRNESLSAALKISYDVHKNISTKINAVAYNTTAFEHYVSQPARWEKLTINGSAMGTIDSLNVNASGGIQNLVMDSTLSIHQLALNLDGQLVQQKPQATINLQSQQITAGSINLDSITMNAAIHDTRWDVALSAYLEQNRQLLIAAQGLWDKALDANLYQLDFNTPYNQIRLQNQAHIAYSDSLIQLQNLFLTDALDSSFSMKADAFFNQKDSISITTSIGGINLQHLSNYHLTKDAITGRMNLLVNVSGNNNQFRVNAQTVINQLALEPLTIKQINAGIYYPGDSLYFNTAIHNAVNDSIYLEGVTPLTITLQDSLVLSWPETIKAHLKADKTHLSGFFTQIKGLEQPKALLSLDLTANGKATDPMLKGTIDVKQGVMPLPKYGIDYNNIRLKLLIDSTKIQLDSLYIMNQKGYLMTQGFVEMENSLFSDQIKNSNLNITAHEFYLARHRDYEIQINANTFLKDIESKPQFGGNIKVLRSGFNVKALAGLNGNGSEVNVPLLTQALTRQAADSNVTIQIKDTIASKKIKNTNPQKILNNLTGSLKIEIPRNTWLRSPDMQMEVYGNLDIIKNSSFFELFGTLGIQRGFYTLYGKKLNIDEGEFTFTGGEKFDPLLNLKASYIFRTAEKEKKTLSIIVSQRLSNPEIKFQLDKQEIPEADAMAYMLFGQPFDQLNHGNQQGVSDAMSSRLLSNLVTTQLSKTIGKTLNLDMIEIDASDNWQNSTFMVGKYITNDLFVTYQRSFGQSGENDITPETITLEYEITRRLSLRLLHGKVNDSGVDIILKFEK